MHGDREITQGEKTQLGFTRATVVNNAIHEEFEDQEARASVRRGVGKIPKAEEFNKLGIDVIMMSIEGAAGHNGKGGVGAGNAWATPLF